MNRVSKNCVSEPRANKLVVVFYFGDFGKWDLDDLAIGTFNFDARSCQGLGGFHAPNCAPHSLAVECYDLNIILAVKRLQCR